MEPVYVIKMHGIVRKDDVEAFAERARETLGGKVLIVDERVDNVWALSEDDARAFVMFLSAEEVGHAEG